MWWLTLRLQRAELILLLVLALLVGALYVSTYGDIRAARDQPTEELFGRGGCAEPIRYLAEGAYCPTDTNPVLPLASELVPYAILLPIGLAAVVAFGPVSEIVGRSYRLTWTQSRTRATWVWSRIGVALTVTVGLTTAATLLAWWWLPYEPVLESVRGYDIRGVVSLAWAVLAVGMVFAATTVLRRPVVAIPLAAIAWVVLRLYSGQIRPYLYPAERAESSAVPSGAPSEVQGWVFRTWFARPDGSSVSQQELFDRCREQGVTDGRLDSCVTATGYTTRVWEFHPDSHFWPLQLVETGLVLGAGVALLGWTVWYWLRRQE